MVISTYQVSFPATTTITLEVESTSQARAEEIGRQILKRRAPYASEVGHPKLEVRVRDHRPECVLDSCEGCAQFPPRASWVSAREFAVAHPNVEATRALAAAETAVRAARDAYLRAPAQLPHSLLKLEALYHFLIEIPSPTSLQDPSR